MNRGNSGGPTFNLSGQVVGINTAIFSPSGGNVGIAFAIPASVAKGVVANLMKDGKVEKITLRETHIRQQSNELTILPNAMMFKNPVKIVTDTPVRRNELVIKIANDCDLPQAEQTIRKALDGVEGINHDMPTGVYAQQFGSSSIDFLVQWWTNTADNDFPAVKSRVIFAIKKALEDADIALSSSDVTRIAFEEQARPTTMPEGTPA